MKPISDQLFTLEGGSRSRRSAIRCSARDLGLPESWFRDAIFEEPELVIGACRAAGLTDDEWYGWRKEFSIAGAGNVDVLLVSASGRVAIVEAKLASNPELRRKVLAQTLDYLTHLPDEIDSMPPLPVRDGAAVADAEDVHESIQQGDVLVVIVSDDIDERAGRLSRRMLGEHLVKQWDLALVDMALYRGISEDEGTVVIVPTVRNVVEKETRQVVRVVVQGESPRARVEVAPVVVDPLPPGRQRWNEERFFGAFAGSAVEVRQVARDLQSLAARFPESLTITWGTGRQIGSMVLKRNNGGLIEVFATGELRFRPNKFDVALGPAGGQAYARALDAIVPGGISTKHYPGVSADTACLIASAVFDAIRSAVEQAETPSHGRTSEPKGPFTGSA